MIRPLITGFATTFRHLFKKEITVSYPDEKVPVFPKFRGKQVLMHVEVKRRNYAFDLRGKSNITIRNLRVSGATITTDATSADITLDGLRAKYISHFVTLTAKDVIYSHSDDSGIRLMGPNSVIRNSIIEYSAGHGIVLGGEGCLADNTLIHNISYGGTYCCGIFPAPGSARNTIPRNTIFRTGRSGIDGVYSNKEIAYNDISRFGLLNAALGALYSARNTDLTGTRIHHNWLHDAGNDAGHQFPVGAGIYFDQNAKPAQIDHNVFWNNHMNDVRLGLHRLGDWPSIIHPSAIAIAFTVSAAVGIFFGFYPARKASRLDPIEALRRE